MTYIRALQAANRIRYLIKANIMHKKDDSNLGFHLNYISALPLHTQISCYFKKAIERGDYKHLVMLPKVKTLSTELSVRLAVVTKAYGLLQNDGYIGCDNYQRYYVKR